MGLKNREVSKTLAHTLATALLLAWSLARVECYREKDSRTRSNEIVVCQSLAGQLSRYLKKLSEDERVRIQETWLIKRLGSCPVPSSTVGNVNCCSASHRESVGKSGLVRVG